jgi:hypothetical protein
MSAGGHEGRRAGGGERGKSALDSSFSPVATTTSKFLSQKLSTDSGQPSSEVLRPELSVLERTLRILAKIISGEDMCNLTTRLILFNCY